MSAFVVGVIVGVREACIVMIARIAGVDGDERQLTQILPPLQPDRFRAVRLCHHLVGEMIGYPVLMDRDERHGLRRGRIPQPFHDTCPLQAKTVFGSGLFGLHQLAVLRTTDRVRSHLPFPVHALVDGQNAPPFGGFAENAQHAFRVGADPADQARLVMMVIALHQR